MNQQDEPTKELQELSEEEKQIKDQLAYIKRFPKLKRWIDLFTDKENKFKLNTYGKRIESAIHAGYDCQSRADFANIGSQNYKKLYNLAAIFAEDMGVSFDKFMEPAMARAMTSENPRWWEMMAEFLGYKEPKNAPSTLIQTNVQTNVTVNESDKVDFDAAFKEFIKNS